MKNIQIPFLRSLVVIAVAILLQVFLSRRKRKWPGLVLPAISFLSSFLYPFVLIALPNAISFGFVLQMVEAWLFVNIRTAIYLVIYFVCRRHSKTNIYK